VLILIVPRMKGIIRIGLFWVRLDFAQRTGTLRPFYPAGRFADALPAHFGRSLRQEASVAARPHEARHWEGISNERAATE
jgi:hypothetical protein